MSADVEAWFATERPSRAMLRALRRILLELGLSEALKWRHPCYMVEGRNVAILGIRKVGCVLTFFKGALLDDPDGHLLLVGPNTRGGRLLHLTSVRQVRERVPMIRGLLDQAITLERAGRQVERDPVIEPVPAELSQRFDEDPELKTAFEALTPGRQRGYLLHFNAAKQAATRATRIERERFRIIAGKGLHDCACGRSARMPRCDGTHRK